MRFRLWIVVVLVAVAAVVALAAYRIQDRADGPEVRFVREMTQHHLQAIDMATRLRDNTDDPVLRTLALDIMLSQQEQVGQMRGWLSVWGVPWGGRGMSDAHAEAMGMATPAQVRSLSELPSEEAEKAFLRYMIRHHEGAIGMTEDLLNTRVPRVVRELAQQMHDAQAGEIKLMTELLAERGEDAPPVVAPADGAGHGEHH